MNRSIYQHHMRTVHKYIKSRRKIVFTWDRFTRLLHCRVFFINHLPSRSLIIPIAPFRIFPENLRRYLQGALAVSLSTVPVITSFPRFTLIGMMSAKNFKFATSFNDIFSTLSGEYLRKFSKKFEMMLLGYPWVWRGEDD